MKSKTEKTAREIIMSAIKRGRTNDEALAAAIKAHPKTTTTLATVNWLRNQIRRKHPTVQTDRATRYYRNSPK